MASWKFIGETKVNMSKYQCSDCGQLIFIPTSTRDISEYHHCPFCTAGEMSVGLELTDKEAKDVATFIQCNFTTAIKEDCIVDLGEMYSLLNVIHKCEEITQNQVKKLTTEPPLVAQLFSEPEEKEETIQDIPSLFPNFKKEK